MAAFDNPSNTTTLAGILQTAISERMIDQYFKKKVFRPLIGERNIILVPNNTQSWKIGQRDTLSFDATTQGTEDTPEPFDTAATDARTLTPIVFAAHALAAWEVVNDTPVKVINEMAVAALTAWDVLEDSDTTYGFAAQYGEACNTTPDHEIGTNATAMDAAIILNGVQLLMTAGAGEPYNHVIDPIQVKELMQDTEAKAWLRQKNGDYAATVGADPNRYLGEIHGVQIWRGDAMVESSGLHSIMFGTNALGLGYKLISNPLNPTPLEFSPTVQWEDSANSYRVTFRVCMNIGGLSDTSTTNRFMVDIIS